MRQPVAERRGLDAQPDDGAAERDGLELRDDQRHQPVRQRGRDEVLVGGHAADVGGAALGVDVQHAVEAVDLEPAGAVAEPEEVRGPLLQPDRGVAGDRREPGPRCRDGLLVCGTPSHRHLATLVSRGVG